jgi:hypothetical protein
MRTFITLIFLFWLTLSNAFLSIIVQNSQKLRHGRGRLTHHHRMMNSDGSDMNDVEEIRRHLESLVSTTHDECIDTESEVKNLPLLTTISRERRQVEIELLQSLEHNDEEAVENLWNLWYSERGPKAHAELLDIEQTLFSDPSRWPKAETRLKSMMDEYGLYFCEPINRLATLYFMQGRYKESKKLCEIVLEQKPWHFGALSGIVMVCVGLQDHSGARTWAAKRLPPLVPDGTTDNHRRVEWTKRAVNDARRLLRDEEDRIRKSFGVRQQKQQQQQREEDSWQ